MTHRLLLLALPATLLAACGHGGPPADENPGALDTSTGDTGPVDTGTPVGVAGLRGEGTVGAGSYTGFEDSYFEGLDGTEYCVIRSQVNSVDLAVAMPPCDGCDWSFTLQTSASAVSQGACVDVDPSTFDGATFSYGYVAGEKGGTLAYYYDGAGWYGTYATASFDAGTNAFSYDWAQSYFYYYGG